MAARKTPSPATGRKRFTEALAHSPLFATELSDIRGRHACVDALQDMSRHALLGCHRHGRDVPRRRVGQDVCRAEEPVPGRATALGAVGNSKTHPPERQLSGAPTGRTYQVRRAWADTACMDRLSVIGLVLAIVAIVGGSVLKGAGISSLWSPAAFVIVIVGTVAAILLHTSPAVFRRAFKILRWVIQPPASDRPQLVARIVEWSNIARRQGLLGLEDQLPRQDDAFLRKGLQMLVDGVEPEAMRNMLEIEVDNQERQDLAAAKVFEGMGIYAPTLGIIGAVLGLMAVMKNLADPAMLGHGIAAAFTATIYGIASANLLFLPVAAKLKSVIHCSTNEREMAIEGLIAIAQGENPRNIESKLAGYLH
ncbi:Motility protein A (modular protein) [Xanthomonas citri pv. bilvae]|nr:Motility protein A (modular protein) [Xanthomonas citri pv. bilvae]